MRHASVETGRVPTALTSGPLPLDAGLVINYPDVAVVLVRAHIGLVLDDNHRPLEEILASMNRINASEFLQNSIKSFYPSQE